MIYSYQKRGCDLEKKVLIAFGLFLLLISLYYVLAKEENKTILVPLGEASNQTKEELEKIPKEVEETVKEIQEEPEEITENLSEEQIIAPPEQKPGILTGFLNLGKAGFYKLKYAGWWVLTRNYLAVAKNTIRFVLGLNLLIKIILIIMALIIILIIWAYYFRDTRSNNLRKARAHHKKGEAAHKRGDEESAEFHYQKAAEYREKAQEQG